MNKFLFKSADADFQKLFQLLDTIQKNVLYLTHQVDFIRKKIITLEADKVLQKQVDDYYDEAASATAGLELEETRQDED